MCFRVFGSYFIGKSPCTTFKITFELWSIIVRPWLGPLGTLCIHWTIMYPLHTKDYYVSFAYNGLLCYESRKILTTKRRWIHYVKLPNAHLGPIGTFCIPWSSTNMYPLHTLDHQIQFPYLGPNALFAYLEKLDALHQNVPFAYRDVNEGIQIFPEKWKFKPVFLSKILIRKKKRFVLPKKA